MASSVTNQSTGSKTQQGGETGGAAAEGGGLATASKAGSSSAAGAGASSEPELSDLESSLLALEKLDRASPDLWPDQIPGVSQFIPLDTPNESPAANNVLHGLNQDDLHTIQQLGNLPLYSLLEEVKRLQNIAYQLGLEETKEMTRGKYLNILRK